MGTTLLPARAERTNLPEENDEITEEPDVARSASTAGADLLLAMGEPIGNDGHWADRDEATPWPMRASPCV